MMTDTVLEYEEKIARLQEELAHCKTDKEFVWSLWKQLQGQSPHLTEAISTAVMREKSKSDRTHKQLLDQLKTREKEANGFHQTLGEREKEIMSLTVSFQKLEEERNRLTESLREEKRKTGKHCNQMQLLSQELSMMKSIVTEKESSITQHHQTMESMLLRVGSLEEQLKSVNQEKEELLRKSKDSRELVDELRKRTNEQAMSLADSQSLTAELKQRSQELRDARQSLQDKEKSMQQLKEELTGMYGVCDAWVSQTADLEVTVKQLQAENSHLKAEQAMTGRDYAAISRQLSELQTHSRQLEHENKLKTKLLNQQQKPHPQDSEEAASSDGQQTAEISSGPDCQQQLEVMKELLERTEKELFDLRALHDVTDKQLSTTSLAHDRRLERMKTLRRSHSLVLQQLKTYEEAPSPQEEKKRRKGRQLNPSSSWDQSRSLDSSSVWNELAACKSKCLELERKLMAVEEEKDSLEVLHAQQQATLITLRASLQEERTMLKEKVTALQKLEKEPALKLIEMEKTNLSLRAENTKLSSECRHLEEKAIEATGLAAQLQSKMIDLRHQQMIEKLTKSTMTESVTKTDSTTQVDLALSAQPSSTSVEPYHTCSPSEVSPVASSSSLPSTGVNRNGRGHKRARSEGEIAVHESRMRDALVKVKDLSESVQTGMPLSEALQRHRERVTPRYQQQRVNQCDEPKKREEKQRQCSGLNCLWRQQLKSSQQRLKTLSRQLAVLGESKNSLSQSLQQEREERLEAEKETKTVQQKLHKSKLTIQELQGKVDVFVMTQAELQGKVAALESMGLGVLAEQDRRSRYEDDIRRLTEEKKSLGEKCMSQAESLKRAQNQAADREKEIRTHLDRITRLMRDVKQKKQLIDDQRKKLGKTDEGMVAEKEKIVSRGGSAVVNNTQSLAVKYSAAEDSQQVELPDAHTLYSVAPYRVRLLLVGKTEVGKSAIYNRYATDSYNDKETATFGIVTYKKHLTIIGKTVEVELVDTAGREGCSLPKHFRWEMTHGALLVYDVSNASSFDKIRTMPDSLRQGLPPNAIIALVGNKIDLGQRDVMKSDAKKFAKKQNLCWFEVSAKTGEQVDKMFEECIKMVLHKIDAGKLHTFYNPDKELPPNK